MRRHKRSANIGPEMEGRRRDGRNSPRDHRRRKGEAGCKDFSITKGSPRKRGGRPIGQCAGEAENKSVEGEGREAVSDVDKQNRLEIFRRAKTRLQEERFSCARALVSSKAETERLLDTIASVQRALDVIDHAIEDEE